MNKQLTLYQLNSQIKDSLQLAFPESLWVVAEIGEIKVNRNGHCYIELVEKDNSSDEIIARARATIWSWQFRFIQPYFESTTGQSMTAGLKVLVYVNVAFHEAYGLSVNITDIDPSYTLGDMARKRKEVIEKLTSDGIIDMNKEIDFPDIPSRIAIISSPTSAGYEDFMNQLHSNNNGYSFNTQLFEANMQGTKSAQSIIDALEHIYTIENRFDVVVIIRGGGSQMDLSCFDDYELAYHVAQFPLPVLTGIGHEKDESVTDMVAYKKLKTPTAVAEFLIEKFDIVHELIYTFETELAGIIDDILKHEENRVNQALRLFKPVVKASIEKAQMQLYKRTSKLEPIINELIDSENNNLSSISNQIKYNTQTLFTKHQTTLNTLLQNTAFYSKVNSTNALQTIDTLAEKTKNITQQQLNNEESKLIWLEKSCKILDPKSILKRGFSITLKNGKAIKSDHELNDGDLIESLLFEGKIQSEIKKQK